MAVHIKLSTSLRSAVPGYDPMQGLTASLPADKTVRALAGQLGLKGEAIKIVMINGSQASLDSSLADGDSVALFPAIGGG